VKNTLSLYLNFFNLSVKSLLQEGNTYKFTRTIPNMKIVKALIFLISLAAGCFVLYILESPWYLYIFAILLAGYLQEKITN